MVTSVIQVWVGGNDLDLDWAKDVAARSDEKRTVAPDRIQAIPMRLDTEVTRRSSKTESFGSDQK